MSTEYSPATLRVAPNAIPAVRAALDATIADLSEHLAIMVHGGQIPEPWLGDSASHAVQQIYNQHVMQAPDGPFSALLAYRDQLTAASDALKAAEDAYRRTEGDNADLWGRS